MDSFVTNHRAQLDFLNIPDFFFPSIKEQLDRSITVDSDGVLKEDTLLSGGRVNLTGLQSGDNGSMVVIPHLCSWDMLEEPSKGLWKALSKLSVRNLQEVYKSLKHLWSEPADDIDARDELLDQICDPRTWSRVILYKRGDRVRGALPAPPYLPQVELSSEMDTTEADLSGPFPFQFHPGSKSVIDCSLAYLNPNKNFQNKELLPTIDVVPSYSVPNSTTRSVRYAALLGDFEAPEFALATAKQIHANFVHQMHLIRQGKLEQASQESAKEEESAKQPTSITKVVDEAPMVASTKVWRVYTDYNDPLELAHPEHGLSEKYFVLVSDPKEADIIYSYSSLFVHGPLNDYWKRNESVLINQFPYEGAFVQKDHLGRELLKQHGLPRPNWAVETYDLDEQLGEFVGAALLEKERTGVLPLWIIKPANGTQSQGHVVTRSIAQVLRLLDSGGGVSRVAQRYIENPVCYKGRKLDCRCLVMMISAKGKPTLYMYNRVYFRIAAHSHSIAAASDLMDHQSVLSAMHLVASHDAKDVLPIDSKTIAQLEADYGEIGFRWNQLILPKLKTLIRELFTGMAEAYPAMGESYQYRALYGVDTMFEIVDDCRTEPRLTEVSFCPSNNAICDAYERDVDNYKSYTTDVFRCLFLGEISERITKI